MAFRGGNGGVLLQLPCSLSFPFLFFLFLFLTSPVHFPLLWEPFPVIFATLILYHFVYHILQQVSFPP